MGRKRKRRSNADIPRLNKISPGRVSDSIEVMTSSRVENEFIVQGLTFRLASAKIVNPRYVTATYRRVIK